MFQFNSSAAYIFHIRLLILIQLVMNFLIAVLSYKYFCGYRVIQLNKYILYLLAYMLVHGSKQLVGLLIVLHNSVFRSTRNYLKGFSLGKKSAPRKSKCVLWTLCRERGQVGAFLTPQRSRHWKWLMSFDLKSKSNIAKIPFVTLRAFLFQWQLWYKVNFVDVTYLTELVTYILLPPFWDGCLVQFIAYFKSRNSFVVLRTPLSLASSRESCCNGFWLASYGQNVLKHWVSL